MGHHEGSVGCVGHFQHPAGGCGAVPFLRKGPVVQMGVGGVSEPGSPRLHQKSGGALCWTTNMQ